MQNQRIGLVCALLLLCMLWGCALGETNGRVKHYLLLGEDGYAATVVDDARTDTVVLLSLDEQYGRVIVTSILRDCMIDNPKGNPTKVNLLYRYHGFEGIRQCVERELGIEIEGSVLVNFEHVKPVIDALGGVDITIDMNEYLAIRKILLDKDPNMPDGPGPVHMTGRIALAYMRDRQSGSGDFSRTQRQRNVLSQLFGKCTALSLGDLIGIYNEVSPGMKMSLSVPGILGAIRSGYALAQGGAQLVGFRIPQDGTYSYTTISGSSSALDVRWATNRARFHALLDGEEEGE